MTMCSGVTNVTLCQRRKWL